jgi:hypothetical protein
MSPSTALSRGVPSRSTLRVKPCAFVPEFRRPSRAPRDEIAEGHASVESAVAATRARLGGDSRRAATYAAYFDDFARSHREREARAGAARLATARESALREEAARETEASLAELDAFDDRVEYFHTTTLRERLEDRGWIAPRGTKGTVERGAGGKKTLVVDKVTPR